MRAVAATPPVHHDKIPGWMKAVLGVVFGAFVAFLFTTQANNEASLQNLQLQAIQRFEDTGKQVDQAASQLSEAIADRQGVPEAQKALVGAVTSHSSEGFAMRDMVGPGEMDAYHRQLKQLQTEALTADDVPTGLAMAQTHIRTIEHRAALVKEARDRTLMPKGFVQRLKSVLGI